MRRTCWLLTTLMLLSVTTAWAQGLSGALIGTVKDEQGGMLQGALVHVTSPALIGGVLTTTTNEKGQLRFPVLAPGTYALAVSRCSNPGLDLVTRPTAPSAGSNCSASTKKLSMPETPQQVRRHD